MLDAERKVCAQRATKPDQEAVGPLIQRKEPRNWDRREEYAKNPPRVRHGGGAARYNSDASSLDRFQAQPKWEISDYMR